MERSVQQGWLLPKVPRQRTVLGVEYLYTPSFNAGMRSCKAEYLKYNRNLRQSGARNNGPVAAATCSLGNHLVRAACFIGSKATNKGLDQFETAFMNCGCLVLGGKLQGVSELAFVTVWLPCAGRFPLFSCRSRKVMWGSRPGVACSNMESRP